MERNKLAIIFKTEIALNLKSISQSFKFEWNSNKLLKNDRSVEMDWRIPRYGDAALLASFAVGHGILQE
jgi:hypothetical protein